jgi:dienelactone hydrolase
MLAIPDHVRRDSCLARFQRWAAAACLFAITLPVLAQTTQLAQSWTVETITTRAIVGGGQAQMAIALRVPANQPAKHVVLYASPNTTSYLKLTSGEAVLNLVGPWVRAAALLSERGIAVAFADVPSDMQGKSPAQRNAAEVRQDLQAAVAYLRKRFAGAPIHLGLYSTAAAPILDVASRIDDLGRIAVVSGGFLNSRSSDWSRLGERVMLIHAPSAACAETPFLEAQFVARKNRFTLVEAGYEQAQAKFDCGRGSQHSLAKLETEFADTVTRWLEAADAPKNIGYPNPQTAWREQIVTYPAPGLIGVNQLEMTLLLPDGPGPFPVVVFNHGDVDKEHAYRRNRQRVRDPIVAWEFLQHRIAVALPARRGLGMSEGNYPGGNARYDGDPAYKARIHAQDILPALAYLKSRPEIDARRIILTGQSAGGFSVVHIASTNPPGVIGVVNFSGGRTDSTGAEGAGALNKMMVSSFEELGKTTRVPTLWVFAENDSKYAADTIRASHAAYVKAGGVARLSLSAPTAGDGHFIYHRPELWRDALKEFLGEIGASKREMSVKP